MSDNNVISKTYEGLARRVVTVTTPNNGIEEVNDVIEVTISPSGTLCLVHSNYDLVIYSSTEYTVVTTSPTE